MTARQEMLVFGCSADDVKLLTNAVEHLEPALRVLDDPGEFARHAVSQRPLAVVLGVGRDTLAHLDMIPLIRAVRRELPVILIAEDASLELERRARQHKIFYYLVHPIERSEVNAVLNDLLRSRK
jgi:DNA-binding NtrC family response regulator